MRKLKLACAAALPTARKQDPIWWQFFAANKQFIRTCAEIEVHTCAMIEGIHTGVGGGVRIHPENARMSGRHGVQYVAQCVTCAALTPVVWQ